MSRSRVRASTRTVRRVSGPLALAVALIVSASACTMVVDVPVTCSVVGPLFSQKIRTVTSPDDVHRGAQVHVDLTVGWVPGRGAGTVTKAQYTLPLPLDLATVDAVTFVGDDLTGSWVVAGRQLVVTFTGAADQLTVEMPMAKITGTIASDARLGRMEWRTISSWTFEADQPTGHFQGRCVPTDPGTVLNNSNVLP
jgi:hypothetical protein